MLAKKGSFKMVLINADNFKYDKLTNILTGGDVVLEDNISKIKIFTNEIFMKEIKKKYLLFLTQSCIKR